MNAIASKAHAMDPPLKKEHILMAIEETMEER